MIRSLILAAGLAFSTSVFAADPTLVPLEKEPTALAKQLTDAVAAARTGDATAAVTQQRIHRYLGRNTELAKQVRPHIPEASRAQFDDLHAATHSLVGSVKQTATTVPGWNIISPESPETLIAFYKEGEATHGVSWTILAAINLIETRMGRIDAISYAGAVGPMQFLPSTWEAYAVGDPRNTHDAIIGAASYLKAMRAAKDLDKAIWHYNHSDKYVRAVRKVAAALDRDPTLYTVLHGWQVAYRTAHGDAWLFEGYSHKEPHSAEAYCAVPNHCDPK